MQKVAVLVLLILLPFAAAPAAESLAIINTHVIPMTGETVMRSQTVLVEDGRIVAIGHVDDVPVAEDILVIDGTDRYLLPGLFEMHAHVTGTGDEEVRRLLSLFLANGVTTIRGMLGRPEHLDLRRQIAEGGVLGPQLVTSGPSFNGNSVSDAAQAAQMVRAQHAAGYDFLKIHPGLSAAEFNAIADTANALDIPFAGHVPVSVGVSGVLEKGIATIDHLDGYLAALLPPRSDVSGGYGGFFGVMLAGQADESRIAEVVDATITAGAANVATQSLFEQLVNDVSPDDYGSRPEMQYMPEATVARWVEAKEQTISERGFDPDVARRAIELRQRLIRELHAAGGVLLLGSDAPQIFNVPGFSLHHELEFLVAAGLSPYEALYTGTVAPARFLELDKGTIEVGRIADLVLLDDNPLEDIANSRRVHGTLVGGHWTRSAELLGSLE
ncbi:MAG: amidohydrolase family protein [Pseudomonadota bacterium]